MAFALGKMGHFWDRGQVKCTFFRHYPPAGPKTRGDVCTSRCPESQFLEFSRPIFVDRFSVTSFFTAPHGAIASGEIRRPQNGSSLKNRKEAK